MKRKINLDNTFSALRELPIDISFEQVETWLNNNPSQKHVANRWLPYWLVNLSRWRPFN